MLLSVPGRYAGRRHSADVTGHMSGSLLRAQVCVDQGAFDVRRVSVQLSEILLLQNTASHGATTGSPRSMASHWRPSLEASTEGVGVSYYRRLSDGAVPALHQLRCRSFSPHNNAAARGYSSHGIRYQRTRVTTDSPKSRRCSSPHLKKIYSNSSSKIFTNLSYHKRRKIRPDSVEDHSETSFDSPTSPETNCGIPQIIVRDFDSSSYVHSPIYENIANVTKNLAHDFNSSSFGNSINYTNVGTNNSSVKNGVIMQTQSSDFSDNCAIDSLSRVCKHVQTSSFLADDATATFKIPPRGHSSPKPIGQEDYNTPPNQAAGELNTSPELSPLSSGYNSVANEPVLVIIQRDGKMNNTSLNSSTDVVSDSKENLKNGEIDAKKTSVNTMLQFASSKQCDSPHGGESSVRQQSVDLVTPFSNLLKKFEASNKRKTGFVNLAKKNCMKTPSQDENVVRNKKFLSCRRGSDWVMRDRRREPVQPSTPIFSIHTSVLTPKICLGKVLGAGGFGQVYQAVYRNQRVAVKRMHSITKNQRARIASYKAELATLRLSHPNIVKVMTSGCTDNLHGDAYIVMEYAGDRNLTQVLNDPCESLPLERRARYAAGVTSALAFIHNNSVIHNDVKPANIIITPADTCKLTDFGCCQVLAEGPVARHTELTGTYAYRAPELLRGHMPTTRADIYSLGVTLWQMVSRSFPYIGLNPHVVIFGVVAHNLRPLIPTVEVTSPLELRYRELYEECWAASAADRPAADTLCSIFRMWAGLPPVGVAAAGGVDGGPHTQQRAAEAVRLKRAASLF